MSETIRRRPERALCLPFFSAFERKTKNNNAKSCAANAVENALWEVKTTFTSHCLWFRTSQRRSTMTFIEQCCAADTKQLYNATYERFEMGVVKTKAPSSRRGKINGHDE